MKINILYLIMLLGDGGTEKQLVRLIHGLDTNRFAPHVCTLLPSEAHFDELDIPKLELRFTSFVRFSIVRNLLQLARFIREHDIHIVQTFFQDPCLLAALLKPFHHRVRLVGSLRDMGFWRNRRENMKMRLAYPAYTGFVANSEAVKAHFVQADGLDPQRIEVIHNGIDRADLPPVLPWGERQAPPLVGIVANLNRRVKRVGDFLAMAAVVHARRPDVRFAVLGDGWLREQLEAQARAAGLQDVVEFKGMVTEPLPLVRHFRVGVITSESEGLCNAIIEYMACGVPVVATGAGGNPELVEEGVNGFLVPVGAVEAMAEKVLTILDASDLAGRLAQNAAARAAADFSLERMVEKFQAYYQRIFTGSPCAR